MTLENDDLGTVVDTRLIVHHQISSTSILFERFVNGQE